jgi:predicted nucleic acid-binding protein
LGNVSLSVISITTVEGWLLRPGTPLHFQPAFIALVGTLRLLDVTEPIAHRAAMIRNALRIQRIKANLADVLLAATALEHGLTLVTHATQPLAHLPGLTVTDWQLP